MVQPQYAVSWDSYKNAICNGFTSLQQNGEFVDMTLAADGHFVKVHQALVALASPYLKQLITSAPCQHPIIFLNNVSSNILSSLLEYIYTGQVNVPSDSITSFIKTAQALHIKGLEDLAKCEDYSVKMVHDQSNLGHVTGTQTLSLPSRTGTEKVTVPAAAKKIVIKNKSPLSQTVGRINLTSAVAVTSGDASDYSAAMDDTGAHDSDGLDDEPTPTAAACLDKSSSNLQYSMSIRGSLQVILNRYIYNLHSTQKQTGVRRWRCVEYRNHRCKAFLVTKGNVVLNRANLHNHSFHDRKILQKIEKKAVFSALDEAESYKEKEDAHFDNKDEEDPHFNNKDSVKDNQYTDMDFSGDIDDSLKKSWTVPHM